MKTQISRKTFNLKKRYSGVYQQQGRMLTDADWNEKVDLEKQRIKSLMSELVEGGASQHDGFICSTGDYENPTGKLQWGTVLVDGIQASVTAAADASGDAFDYLGQKDFPSAPEIEGPAGLYNFPLNGDYAIYLDVWERSVNYLEDDSLRDAALQGADTCTRTQTMAQVKLCPAVINPENPADNPHKGDATLTLHLREGSTSLDACDPCAREVSLEDNAANYLFRVEVHKVTYSANNIETLILKWSSENAAEQYFSDDVPAGFKQNSYSYETLLGNTDNFSSEKHAGRHFIEQLGSDFPRTGTLYTHDVYPSVDAQKIIRRWDGFIELKQASPGNWTIQAGEDRGETLAATKSLTEHAYVYLNSNYPGNYAQNYLGLDADEVLEETPVQRLIINLNTIVFQLELDNKAFMAGDYWFVPVRNKEDDIAADEALLLQAEPEGIVHHYYRVAHLSSGVIDWEKSFWALTADNGYRRSRLPFTSLDHIGAGDVAYVPPVCYLQGDTDEESTAVNRTVQYLMTEKLGEQWLIHDQREASIQRLLDRLLCDFTASHLPLNRNDAQCLLAYEAEQDEVSIHSVQDALNSLCLMIDNLTAEDIAFNLAECQQATQVKPETVINLLSTLPDAIDTPDTVKKILMNLLCDMDARHIPLYKDARLCEQLREDSQVVSIQDALNVICARDSTGCVTYTLEPGADIQAVFNQLAENEDASICFQPGLFEIDDIAVLKNAGNIKITGAGAASRILVKNNKCALHIDNCKHVTIRDLSISSKSLQPLVNGKQEFPNGVLTLSNCDQATIEYLQLRCAASSRYVATCLTARSTKLIHILRIKSCDLTTGHYQAGMLLLNASIALVEGNTITVGKRPKFLTFETIVRDNTSNVGLRRELADRVLVIDPDEVKKSTSSRGNILVKVGNYNVFFNSSIAQDEWFAAVKENKPAATDKRSKADAEKYVANVIAKTAKTPPEKSAFDRRIKSYKNADPEKTTELSDKQIKNLIATSSPVAEDNINEKRTVQLKLGRYEVKFDSALSTSVWVDIINKAPPVKTATVAQVNAYITALKKELLQNKDIREAVPGVNGWFNDKKGRNPAAGKYGIVCAGKNAGDIKILNNNIKGVTEAIRIAISNGGFTDVNSSGLQIETATIINNRMSLVKPVSEKLAQRAMMVGNCKHLIVENNRMIVTAAAAENKHYYEGLRIYGNLGRTIIIRQNSLANCKTGVYLNPLNAINDKEDDSWRNNLWIVADNIFPGADTTVIPAKVRGYDSNLL